MDAYVPERLPFSQYDDRTRKIVLTSLLIDGITLASSGWLFLGIYRQGLKRLRTKLLLGMFLSNVMFSILSVITLAMDMSGNRFIMGTTSCNAMGFIFILVVFTQHGWSLTIAGTTYLMLRFPTSRAMGYVEKYWYAMPISIWADCLILTGGWYWQRDFAPYPGSVEWDYMVRGGRLNQNIGEFMPRILAFCTMVGIYISLFFFLRRPDSVNISGVNSKSHSSWTGNIRQKAFGVRKKAKRASDDLPPWEKLELDCSGLVVLPEPEPAVRKAPVENLVDVIKRSPAHLTSLFKETNKEDCYASSGNRSLERHASHSDLTSMPIVGHGLNIRFPSADGKYPASIKSGTSVESEHESEEPQETMQAFFQAQENMGPVPAMAPLPSSEANPESASAYLNRQASLLMFWFPVAYTFTLMPSLVRLIAEIARGKDSVTLRLIQSIATISLGLQDVFIYGIVEWTIKIRVHRRLPDHL